MKTYNDIENLVGRLRHEDIVEVLVDNLNNITSWYYEMYYDDDCGLREFHRVRFEDQSSKYVHEVDPKIVDKLYYIIKDDLLKRGLIEMNGDIVIKSVFK